MSWDGYITNLKAVGPNEPPTVAEAAIVGFEKGSESVWTGTGHLQQITADEIRALVTDNRGSLFANGVTLGGVKCTVIRDQLMADPWTMDLKTKTSPADGVSVAKSQRALIIVKGCPNIHGGLLNKKVYDLALYLKKQGY